LLLFCNSSVSKFKGDAHRWHGGCTGGQPGRLIRCLTATPAELYACHLISEGRGFARPGGVGGCAFLAYRAATHGSNQVMSQMAMHPGSQKGSNPCTQMGMHLCTHKVTHHCAHVGKHPRTCNATHTQT
jgi:hypothetical protein